MEALDAYMRRSFENRVLVQLAAVHPAWFKSLGEPAARQLIQTGVSKSLAYGIESEGDIQAMIEFMVEHTPHFERQPPTHWARELLEDKTLSGEAKIRVIRERLKPVLPEESEESGAV